MRPTTALLSGQRLGGWRSLSSTRILDGNKQNSGPSRRRGVELSGEQGTYLENTGFNDKYPFTCFNTINRFNTFINLEEEFVILLKVNAYNNKLTNYKILVFILNLLQSPIYSQCSM